jgi:putative restriction endonuclease
VEGDVEPGIRVAAFAHLDRLIAASPDGALRSRDVNTFVFDGRPIPLIVQSGIWKPAMLDAALTIRTTFIRTDRDRPYEDQIGDDGLLRYKYRGADPNHSDNRALRRAMAARLPLAYLIGIERGVYVPQYPVWVVGEDAPNCEFAVTLDQGQWAVDIDALPVLNREYVARLTRIRLHQPVFRARVLRAYAEQCALCRLRHPELLDAAHIIPDGQPRGEPVVPNGISFCKIHHAAFDKNIIGVRPDLVVEVQPGVLREVDGPMLRHGIQDMAGRPLEVPRSRDLQPDRARLAERYDQFRAAG